VQNSGIKKLLDTNPKPAPYDSKNLTGLDVDKNNLVSIHLFNLENNRLQWRNKVYTLCPMLEQSNSSYWIFQAILKFAIQDGVNFKIRLDPFIEVSETEYNPMFHKMLVHGKPLDWQKMSTLRNDDFGKWYNEKEYDKTGFTDYVWAPKNDEIHFTCEELPKLDFNEIRTSRYFHAIFNKGTGGIKHCDGAIRVYSEDELEFRSKKHVKDPEVRKAGKRIKIFQFESNDNLKKEISQDTFCHLATNYFVWNEDVQKYFN